MISNADSISETGDFEEIETFINTKDYMVLEGIINDVIGDKDE